MIIKFVNVHSCSSVAITLRELYWKSLKFHQLICFISQKLSPFSLEVPLDHHPWKSQQSAQNDEFSLVCFTIQSSINDYLHMDDVVWNVDLLLFGFFWLGP